MTKKWGGQCPPGPPGFDATEKQNPLTIAPSHVLEPLSQQNNVNKNEINMSLISSEGGSQQL